MQLACKSCGHELHSSDVDFEALRASCRHCGWQLGGGAETAYRTALAATPDDAPKENEPPPSRPLPWLPSYITVTEWGSGAERMLEINIKPRQRWAVFLLVPLLLFQVAILVVVGKGVPLVVAPFYMVLGYALAAYMGNRRHVYVSKDTLSVTSSPLPWFTTRIPVGDLVQLWVDEMMLRDGGTAYRLRAKLRHRDVILVDMLDDASGALHLERRIEEMLGIADVPVPGEIDAPR